MHVVEISGKLHGRAVLRAGAVRPPADPESLRRALAERLRATVLISMDVELVPEADVPEAAGPPRFAEAMVSV